MRYPHFCKAPIKILALLCLASCATSPQPQAAYVRQTLCDMDISWRVNNISRMLRVKDLNWPNGAQEAWVPVEDHTNKSHLNARVRIFNCRK